MNYLLPGMGVTCEMYPNTWKTLDNATFLDWPHNFSGHTIPQLAECFIAEHKISQTDTIIGSSLGGMVACEISNILQVEHVVLLGSAKQKEEVAKLFSKIYPWIDYMPLEFIKKASGLIPHPITQMFKDAEAEFIRRMCKAIFQWQGFQGKSKILRIHGNKDPLIPLPKDADVVLNGWHAIALTHEQECIQAIKEHAALS